MHSRANVDIDERLAVLRAEDEVSVKFRQRLWHLCLPASEAFTKPRNGGEYGLRPKQNVASLILGAVPQATVTDGLRPKKVEKGSSPDY